MNAAIQLQILGLTPKLRQGINYYRKQFIVQAPDALMLSRWRNIARPSPDGNKITFLSLLNLFISYF